MGCVFSCTHKRSNQKICGSQHSYSCNVKILTGPRKGEIIKIEVCNRHLTILRSEKNTMRQGRYRAFIDGFDERIILVEEIWTEKMNEQGQIEWICHHNIKHNNKNHYPCDGCCKHQDYPGHEYK